MKVHTLERIEVLKSALLTHAVPSHGVCLHHILPWFHCSDFFVHSMQILSTFGDLALVLGDKFEKYLETVKRMLRQAMSLSVEQVSVEPSAGSGMGARSRLLGANCWSYCPTGLNCVVGSHCNVGPCMWMC
jgi:hypothetical protein